MLVSLVAFACCSSPAFAWGPEAHRLVATLAERDLAVLPRAEIKRLLASEPEYAQKTLLFWNTLTRAPPPAEGVGPSDLSPPLRRRWHTTLVA